MTISLGILIYFCLESDPRFYAQRALFLISCKVLILKYTVGNKA